MATLSATDIYVGDFQNGEEYVEMTPLTSSSWTPIAGGKWSSSDWVTVIKFTIASACISFTLGMTSRTTNSYAASIKYKVTSAEDTSLQSATYTTDGDGSFIVSPGNWVRTTVTFAKKLSAGTHYLYLWGGKSTTDYPYNYYGFYAGSTTDYALTITYDEAATVNVPCYQMYIDNGTEWVPVIPLLDLGDSWSGTSS